MTGEELKQYIKSSGMTVSEIARELSMTPQNITAKFSRQTVKVDFFLKVEDVIKKHCSVLHNNDTPSVSTSNVNGSNSPNVRQTIGVGSSCEALERENKLLREQNEFQKKQIDRLMAMLENKQ